MKSSSKKVASPAASIPEYRIPSVISYLGPKGYTMNKSDIALKDIEILKEKLTAKPAQGYVIGVSKSFPIYRESPKKLYVPRYFGLEHIGTFQNTTISEGDNIDVSFCGQLREHQHEPVNAFLEAVNKDGTCGGGIISVPCSHGKTVEAIYLIAALKKKTLIIVHKEFLVNQWIERMKEFLPHARVGRIQGPIIDIENKDVVIAMLQSVSMKTYDTGTFDSFGFTVVDECHHISSEVFSNALFQIVTKYTLGLSATIDRKDGTSFVIHWFLGPIIYKFLGKEEHDVTVYAIEYRTDDNKFNEVEYDYRGNVQFSTMISKLCAFRDRSDFIIRVIEDLILTNPSEQVMVLGHNRCLLVYLYEEIAKKGFATIGYYMGGLKQSELTESESKQVIIGTYGIAAEGLDIKSLNTLVMVTPKSDVVQVAGRILRSKHRAPKIIDIVDRHSVFMGQWSKRKAYFKKCNYDIRMTTSRDFRGVSDTSSWKQVYNAKENVDDTVQGKCLVNINDFDISRTSCI